MDAADERTFGEKIADGVAKFGGSWKFIFAGLGIIIIWVIFQYGAYCWDKYPFILLNLFLSLVAAFQAPFIMMSQRRCEIKQDLIYRGLFQEVKELVETDLSVEQEIIEQNKTLAEEVAELKKIVQELRISREKE